ncbi:MAG: type II toxin-antitoxin system VapC family toxin [Leptospirales bacterium]
MDGRSILSLAIESGCSAYDAEFVWVARNLNLPLVTADRKILVSFPEIAMTPEQFLQENLR